VTKVILSGGDISPGSPILVELTKNHQPDAWATVVVHWPGVTECSPAKFADVVSEACRLLSNASLELARRRIAPEHS
jgi:hypothetical protein